MIVRRGAADRVFTGGQSVRAIYSGALGGMIYNPRTAEEQEVLHVVDVEGRITSKSFGPFNTLRLDQSRFPFNARDTVSFNSAGAIYGPPEPLFVDLTGPAALHETATTRALYPGQYFNVPAGVSDIWVNAETDGHRFAAIIMAPDVDAPPTPYSGAYPPSGPVTRLNTIPSYLYKQYEEDDDLQAMVAAYNGFTQAFIDWFNALNLPIYPNHSGALLDWVATGLYGYPRPTLYSGRSNAKGPYNTFQFNTLRLNQHKRVSQFSDIAAVSDDVYKRCLTWRFYKGDGRQISSQWLKRRVGRFLFGENGWDAPSSLEQISVIVSDANQLTITIVAGFRRWTAGARFGRTRFNRSRAAQFNSTLTTLDTFAVPAMAPTFVDAVQNGVLETPWQYAVAARIGYLGVAE